jgi:hypothetical protein
MLLDDSEIHLKAGDVLIQQGTNQPGQSRQRAVPYCLRPHRWDRAVTVRCAPGCIALATKARNA